MTPVIANILQPLIDVNEAVLHFFHRNVGFGWGLSIICLTLAIRMVILPLTFKQVRAMQEMQRFNPEIQKIRERYKEDKQRQQEEMMKLYKEHGFNPLGSCLPLVLQLPFFFSLYQTLKKGGGIWTEMSHAGVHKGFLFLPDLTAPLTHHTGALIAMVILYVGSQLGSSYVSSLNVQDKNQRRLLFIFPFVFVPVVINFEAGLLVYWVTTNLFTVSQQLLIRKFLPAPEPHAVGALAAKGSDESGTDDGGGGTSRKRRRGIFAEAMAGARSAREGDGAAATKQDTAKQAAKQTAKPAKQPKASSGSNGKSDGGPRKAPPPSPRKKKKRSGRRR
jgi:YidC/Oxa1 family membrane protein insertase